jgi:hypothetical protein
MTDAIKTSYEALPETIAVPREYVNRRAEVIILLENEVPGQSRFMSEFFGSIPDFPEREDQGTHEPMKMRFPRQFG